MLTYQEIMEKNRKFLNKFDLSQRDAFNLIYTLKDYNIFSRLPLIAMNILNDASNHPEFKALENVHKNMTRETNNLISNTLNSQIFIDHENKMGRKGILTIIDKETGKSKNFWGVVNNRVFAFYKTSRYLNVEKIYRIAMTKIKDSIFTPCFYIYYDNTNEEERKLEEKKRFEAEKLEAEMKKRHPVRPSRRRPTIISKNATIAKLNKISLPPLGKKNDNKNNSIFKLKLIFFR